MEPSYITAARYKLDEARARLEALDKIIETVEPAARFPLLEKRLTQKKDLIDLENELSAWKNTLEREKSDQQQKAREEQRKTDSPEQTASSQPANVAEENTPAPVAARIRHQHMPHSNPQMPSVAWGDGSGVCRCGGCNSLPFPSMPAVFGQPYTRPAGYRRGFDATSLEEERTEMLHRHRAYDETAEGHVLPEYRRGRVFLQPDDIAPARRTSHRRAALMPPTPIEDGSRYHDEDLPEGHCDTHGQMIVYRDPTRHERMGQHASSNRDPLRNAAHRERLPSEHQNRQPPAPRGYRASADPVMDWVMKQ